MIKCVLDNKKYSKYSFKNWILTKTKLDKKDFKRAYEIYGVIRDGKKEREKIRINIAEKLVHLLEKEINKYGKKKKKA